MLVRRIRRGQCIDIAPDITIWPHPAHRRRWFALAVQAPRIMPIVVGRHDAPESAAAGRRRAVVEVSEDCRVRIGGDVVVTVNQGAAFLLCVELPESMVIETAEEAVGCTA